MLSVFIRIPSYGIWVAEVNFCHPQSRLGLLEFLHALLVVFQVTGSLFLLTLFTLVVIADALHQPNEEADAEAGPDAKEGGYQDEMCIRDRCCTPSTSIRPAPSLRAS